MFTTLSTITAAHASAATHMMGPWHGVWAGGLGFLFLLIPLFWIAVIVVLFTFVGRRRRAMWRAGGYGQPAFGGTHSAESTLAERFAQGDLDEVEYRARLEVLRANRHDGV